MSNVVHVCMCINGNLFPVQVIALLVQNMERLDEKIKEDADGVHNTLAIMCELKNEER